VFSNGVLSKIKNIRITNEILANIDYFEEFIFNYANIALENENIDFNTFS
jgi:hypothetical protein